MNASTQQVRRAALLVLLCLAALCGKQTLLAFQPKPALRANTHSQIQHRQQLFPYVHSKPYGRANNKVYPGRADKYVLRAFPDPAIMPTFLEAITFNGVGAIGLALAKQKVLTPAGLVNAGILGLGLWTFLGKEGWLFCVMYLVLGSAVTKIRMKEKEALGIAEKRGGARGPENLWGSAATVREADHMACDARMNIVLLNCFVDCIIYNCHASYLQLSHPESSLTIKSTG